MLGSGRGFPGLVQGIDDSAMFPGLVAMQILLPTTSSSRHKHPKPNLTYHSSTTNNSEAQYKGATTSLHTTHLNRYYRTILSILIDFDLLNNSSLVAKKMSWAFFAKFKMAVGGHIGKMKYLRITNDTILMGFWGQRIR